MRVLRTGAALILVAVPFAVLLVAATEWFNPPFTDDQIRASIVDTWEPRAMVTFAELVALVVGGLVSMGFAALSRVAIRRRTALVAALLCMLAATLTYLNHARLTARATALTGQTFGPLDGLL